MRILNNKKLFLFWHPFKKFSSSPGVLDNRYAVELIAISKNKDVSFFETHLPVLFFRIQHHLYNDT